MKNINKIIIFIAIVILANGCSALQTLDNLTKLQFKIDSVSDFEIQEISISNKSQLGDFSPTEIMKLFPAFTSGELFTSFNLNVIVKNPNASGANSSAMNIEIVSFPWELQFNNKKILDGNITKPIKLTGAKKEEVISLKIYLNLFDLLSGNNLNELLKTTLNVGGKNSSTKNISIYAKPVIGSIIGNISYPNKIKIVDYEFR